MSASSSNSSASASAVGSTRTIKAYAAFDASGKVSPWSFESRPLGERDVEVQISHCGICASDTHQLDSLWGPTAYPCVAGHEIIGTVVAAGPAVDNLQLGDTVGVGPQVWACLARDASRPCRVCGAGEDNLCDRAVITFNAKYEDGSVACGGFAEHIRVLSDYAFKIPAGLPSDVAAPLLCAGVTVFSPFKRLGIKAGDRVGVVGIGGLGHLAVQFARAFGATPVAFSRSESKRAEVMALGGPTAEYVDLSDDAQAAAARDSVDVLLVTANAASMPYDQYLSLVRKRGALVLVGIPPDAVTFSPFLLVVKHLRVIGSAIGSIQDSKDMLELAARENVRAVVEKLPMSRINEGLDRVRSGNARYRVVLEN